VAEGTVDDLRARTRESLVIRAEPIEEARRLVANSDRVDTVEIVDGILRVETDPSEAPSLNRALVNAGIAVSELRPERASLEEVFFELTREPDPGERT
jgi:ABC-2 type transport system ATP-binding protein